MLYFLSEFGPIRPWFRPWVNWSPWWCTRTHSNFRWVKMSRDQVSLFQNKSFRSKSFRAAVEHVHNNQSLLRRRQAKQSGLKRMLQPVGRLCHSVAIDNLFLPSQPPLLPIYHQLTEAHKQQGRSGSQALFTLQEKQIKKNWDDNDDDQADKGKWYSRFNLFIAHHTWAASLIHLPPHNSLWNAVGSVNILGIWATLSGLPYFGSLHFTITTTSPTMSMILFIIPCCRHSLVPMPLNDWVNDSTMTMRGREDEERSHTMWWKHHTQLTSEWGKLVTHRQKGLFIEPIHGTCDNQACRCGRCKHQRDANQAHHVSINFGGVASILKNSGAFNAGGIRVREWSRGRSFFQ